MLREILRLFGYKIEYVCEWGAYAYRYDGIDHTMRRPIHKDMSVAPPWAKRKIVKIDV